MYVIEGNIGAGKTTFLNIINKKMPHVHVVDEPLALWHKKGQGQSLLTKFYKETSRWAFTMEMFTLMCRIQEHMREQEKSGQYIVMERSIYSGYYCFALNSYKQGFMNSLEWEILKQWFTYLVHGKCKHPEGFIYLHVSPQVAYERTKKRNRSGEDTIPLAYFEQIDQKLNELLIEKKDLLPGLEKIPVLQINCNEDFSLCEEKQKEMTTAVEDFFLETKKTPFSINPEKSLFRST